MKKVIAIIMLCMLFITSSISVFAENGSKSEAENVKNAVSASTIDLNVNGAYLMEANTGKILYAKGEFEAASPASVTKIMTLLLVCEALEAGNYTLDDTVTISSNAASMGGSQVFLEEGERFTVEELIKCTVIASANDAAVALSEFTSGSESEFVNRMNARAVELGLKNTAFENTTGLDDTVTNHYSCPADIATMSRELIKHDIILKYSSIWQDTIRNGEFTLTNTNRLVRYYDGCNGLKTGSTDKAGYCVSATAKRGNMQLIAVIMGAETRDKRNEAARTLLDYGFANYAVYEKNQEFVENIPVLGGTEDFLPVYSTPFSTVVNKSKLSSIEAVYEIPENLNAPIAEGDTVGKIIYMIDGENLGECEIKASLTIDKISLWNLFIRILAKIVAG